MIFKKSSSVTVISDAEKKQVVAAIQEAEKTTSGEIRVFMEKRCKSPDPLQHAASLFSRLRMENTKDRNAILIYIAYKDRKLAVYGDEGIHAKVGQEYWEKLVGEMLALFRAEKMADGLETGIRHLGQSLAEFFPWHNEDKNELPDDIVFGD